MFICRLILCFIFFMPAVQAGSKQDPVITGLKLDRFEFHNTENDDVLYLEGETYLSQDAYTAVLKAEVEWKNGSTHDVELQLLYGVPISTYWDVYAGVRNDFKPDPNRTWGVLSLEGLAPGFIEMTASVFLGEGAHTAARLELEYEMALSDRWMLTPEAEIYVTGQHDEAIRVGVGLSKIEASLLLSYNIHPQVAPYAGVKWSALYGETADYADGEDEESALVLGVKASF